MKLTEIANRYELDKGTLPANLTSWHQKFPDHATLGYTEVYDDVMYAGREAVRKFAEIGIADPRFPGQSVKMWAEYFPGARIYGIDNFWGYDPKAPIPSTEKDRTCHDLIEELEENPRVSIRVIDQSDRRAMADFFRHAGSDFDYIVEDGAHWPSHCMISLACCLPHIKSGGWYFTEDLQSQNTAGHAAYDNWQITALWQEFIATGNLRRLYIRRDEHAMLLEHMAEVKMVHRGPTSLLAVRKK